MAQRERLSGQHMTGSNEGKQCALIHAFQQQAKAVGHLGQVTQRIIIVDIVDFSGVFLQISIQEGLHSGDLQLIRFCRIQRDPEYRERMEVEVSDERNQFLQGKAWQWAGTLFIVTAGIGVIVLRIVGQDMLSLAASYAVCLLLVLYWGSWMVLRKKY